MKYSIQTLNKISKAGTDRFCDAYTISDDAKDPDAILVRSASLHDTSFGDNLKQLPVRRRRQQHSAGSLLGGWHLCIQHTGCQCQCRKGTGAHRSAHFLP